MIFKSIIRTLKTGVRGYFIKLLLLSLFGTAVGYGVFLYGVKALLMATSFVPWGWVEWLLDWFVGAGTVVLAVILFPTILPLIANIFQEEIAAKIEKHEYDIKRDKKLPLLPEIMAGLSFAGWSLLLNLLILPFWLIGIYPFIYIALNSHLLGREFFEIVVGRHIGRKEARNLRKDYRGTVFLSGGVILLLTITPFLNLLAPFFAVALMVHFYRDICSKL